MTTFLYTDGIHDEVLWNRQLRFTEKFYGAYVVTVYFRVSDAMLFFSFSQKFFLISVHLFPRLRGYPDIEQGLGRGMESGRGGDCYDIGALFAHGYGRQTQRDRRELRGGRASWATSGTDSWASCSPRAKLPAWCSSMFSRGHIGRHPDGVTVLRGINDDLPDPDLYPRSPRCGLPQTRERTSRGGDVGLLAGLVWAWPGSWWAEGVLRVHVS